MIRNFFRHLGKVLNHKRLVFIHCVKCGLVWRGIVHDLSKFSLVEFSEGVKYYVGTYSPISKARKENGYSLAWIHHKGRNKHHIEYWQDIENEQPMNMPYKYAVECVCDKIAATKNYKGKNYCSSDVLKHFSTHAKNELYNPKMKEFFIRVFTDLIEVGEKYVLNKKYMKKIYNEVVLDNDENHK